MMSKKSNDNHNDVSGEDQEDHDDMGDDLDYNNYVSNCETEKLLVITAAETSKSTTNTNLFGKSHIVNDTNMDSDDNIDPHSNNILWKLR